jgi:hypothetical protein
VLAVVEEERPANLMTLAGPALQQCESVGEIVAVSLTASTYTHCHLALGVVAGLWPYRRLTVT